jgi:hypothetical protein
MDDNRRESPRFEVSLYVERREGIESAVHIKNLSSSGFLVRGAVLAGHGGVFHASFRVHPSSGDARVSTRGTVVHSLIDGHNSEFGIRIDGFGSPEEESAYQSYVRELEERTPSREGRD